MRLLRTPPARIDGEILLEGKDLMQLSDRQMRRIRGKDIAMVFQEPMRSLNPVMRIGRQIVETLRLHETMSNSKAEKRALELLKLVEIPDAGSRMGSYPHQLSGGLRQRVMIAMALACSPQILIADEPTTALDVTIQAQILSLLKRIQSETGMSIVLITHDLGVVADIVDSVAVFYAGTIVEQADKRTIFYKTAHPYTQGLLECIPTLKTDTKRLKVIEGSIPNPAMLPDGCAFHPRCRHATDRCRKEKPILREYESGHLCACHNNAQLTIDN